MKLLAESLYICILQKYSWRIIRKITWISYEAEGTRFFLWLAEQGNREACVFSQQLSEKVHEKAIQVKLRTLIFAGGIRSFYSCLLQVSEVD